MDAGQLWAEAVQRRDEPPLTRSSAKQVIVFQAIQAHEHDAGLQHGPAKAWRPLHKIQGLNLNHSCC